MGELLKLLGFSTPLIYATAAYGLFFWLDKEASDEAKAALARTMLLKDYKNNQIASALVEVFDRIYTYPLLSWRAFFRSLVFSTVVIAIYAVELGVPAQEESPAIFLILVWPLCIFSDYLALFVIRALLVRSGTKPVVGLGLGTVWGVVFSIFWPATALVFVWLPLFALGIVIVRLLTPLSWIVGRTQWFLKEGKEHPLKAIGYVAAVAVFLGTVAGRAIFSALQLAL